MWEMDNDTLAGRLLGHDAVNSVAVQPGGELLASAGAEGLVKIWETAAVEVECMSNIHKRARESKMTLAHNGAVNAVVFGIGSTNKSIVATASQDGFTCTWSLRDGTQIHKMNVLEPFHTLAYDLDGRWIATSSLEVSLHIRLWSTNDGTCTESLESGDYHQRRINALAFSSDNVTMLSA